MFERLTYWNEEYGCWSYKCASGDVAKYLAAYEDSGLSPEEVQKLKQAMKEIGEGIHEVHEIIVQAKAEGRLVVLPCKGEELREKYRALTSPTGDGVQTYTTGYRNGHRNGQAELIAYLLQIDLGTREAAEKPLGGGEDGSSKDK